MKKIGLLVLAMIMVLGTLGVGYAYWTQNLYISGSVQTGELEVILANNVDPGDTGSEWAADGFGCAVASDIVGDTLQVTVTGIYPGYNNGQGQPYPLNPFFENNYAAIDFQIVNTGTIPVYLVPEYDVDFMSMGRIEFWGDAEAGAFPIFPGNRTSVIGPTQALNGKVILACRAESTPPELTTYSFGVTFTAHQANE